MGLLKYNLLKDTRVAPLRVSDGDSLSLWLDAADPSTILESGGLVSQWNDKSGNGNNVTQGTGANKPTTGVTTQNGKNVLDFDGNDSLDMPSALFSISNAANTIFVVGKRNVDSGSQVLMIFEEGSGNFRAGIFYDSAAGTVTARNDTGAGTNISSSGITTDFAIMHSTFDGVAGQTVSMNGVTNSNAGGSAESGIDIGTIGSGSASLPLTGSIAEIIIYNRELSAFEILLVEQYLSNKWGVSLIFNPLKFNDLQLWLDGNDANSITESSGLVSQWDDKSGNANHATQAVGSEQPIFTANVQKGKSVVRFDGVDDGMITSLSITAPYTIYAIFSYRSPFVAFRRAVNGSNNWLVGPYDQYISHFAVTNWVARDIVAATENQFFSASAINNSAASTFYVDGVDVTQDSTQIGSPSTIGLGAEGAIAEPLEGDLAEVIIYDRVLSDLERQEVDNYINMKWGLPFSPLNIAGIVLWLDGSDSTTITESSGLVSQWDDKSSNANHAVQGTGSKQPTTNASTQNSLNIIDFDGVNDSMAFANEDNFDLAQVSVFVVGSGSTGSFMGKCDPATLTTDISRRKLQFQTSVFNSGADTTLNVSMGSSAMEVRGFVSRADNDHTWSIDGIQMTSSAAMNLSTFNDAQFNIGGVFNETAEFLNGSIAEILIYNSPLSSSEHTAITNYLLSKWGI